MPDKSVIIVSPYFPPSNLAGVHRARHLAKNLPAHGWRPIILCVAPRFHETALDHELASLVPPDAEVVEVEAIPTRLSRRFGLGEISLRAWFPLRRALFRLIEKHSADAVLITGSPFYPMLLAGSIKRRSHVPVVLDFQDPWVSAWGATRSLASKAGISHALAKLLEPIAVRNADFITTVSDQQNREMRDRYPQLSAERMVAIPIGGDPDDFRLGKDQDSSNLLEAGRVNFSYVGTYWPRAEPTTRLVLRALRRLREVSPGVAETVRLNFIGTTYGRGAASCVVMPLADEYGIADLVREIPDRRPYGEAMGAMANSDVLLIIGSDEPHYTASKVAPVLLSGKPYLALLHGKSSAIDVLRRAGGGIVCSFDSAGDLPGLEPELARSLERLATGRSHLAPPSPAAYRDFTADAVAERFASIFDSLTSA